jgi:hypothetical protein
MVSAAAFHERQSESNTTNTELTIGGLSRAYCTQVTPYVYDVSRHGDIDTHAHTHTHAHARSQPSVSAGSACMDSARHGLKILLNLHLY